MSPGNGTAPVAARLSTPDRQLPVWILAAMAVGLVGGRLTPGLGPALDAVSVSGVSLPIATFGVTSGQALAGVVGPLIEVPVLVALVYVSLAARRHWREPA